MKNKQKLLDYLKARDLMIIATAGKDPTASTIYYGIDGKFNFYIVTPPNTEHGNNISKNHKVACVITDTNQPMYKTKFKIGAQIKGNAKQLKEKGEMKKALEVWSKNKKSIVNEYMQNIEKNIWESRPFIIVPSEIKWFNEELYGEEGVEIFKF